VDSFLKYLLQKFSFSFNNFSEIFICFNLRERNFFFTIFDKVKNRIIFRTTFGVLQIREKWFDFKYGLMYKAILICFLRRNCYFRERQINVRYKNLLYYNLFNFGEQVYYQFHLNISVFNKLKVLTKRFGFLTFLSNFRIEKFAFYKRHNRLKIFFKLMLIIFKMHSQRIFYFLKLFMKLKNLNFLNFSLFFFFKS